MTNGEWDNDLGTSCIKPWMVNGSGKDFSSGYFFFYLNTLFSSLCALRLSFLPLLFLGVSMMILVGIGDEGQRTWELVRIKL